MEGEARTALLEAEEAEAGTVAPGTAVAQSEEFLPLEFGAEDPDAAVRRAPKAKLIAVTLAIIVGVVVSLVVGVVVIAYVIKGLQALTAVVGPLAL